MKVLLAKNAGFCMGVRRAMDATLDIMRREKRGVASFGPLIHNPQVLDLLAERGLTVLQEIPSQSEGTVIIRAHGVPPSKKLALLASGARIEDATCPRVVKVQVIIEKHRRQGCRTVIVGDPGHAEVDGLLGFAGEGGMVVNSLDQARRLAVEAPYIIVSQTTQDEAGFAAISGEILSQNPGGKVFNTICNSTHKRQDEIRRLCLLVEAMVVVGGKNSANTQRLGEIVRGMGRPVYVVETEEELEQRDLGRYGVVGVTAGASTPSWLINRVVRALEAMPGRGDGRFAPLFQKMQWFLLTTNICAGVTGAALSAIALILLSQPLSPLFPTISFSWLFAMHNYNRFADQTQKKFDDPVRAMFYHRFRFHLLATATSALFVSLALAASRGTAAFFFLAGMSLFGVFYSEAILPAFLRPYVRLRVLRGIPCSKTALVGMAWAFVTVFLPVWADVAAPRPSFWLVFAGIALLVYVRIGLFDLFEAQGDRIVGKETLPVCLGERRSFAFLYVALLMFSGGLAAGVAAGMLPALSFFLLPLPVSLYVLVFLYERKKIFEGPRIEAGVELVYLSAAVLLAGAVSFLGV